MEETGAPHFGDIMGGVEGGSSRVHLSNFDPMERVVLTANGNLQRIMSSFYDATVAVDIVKCEKIGENVYDREVTLSVSRQSFCTAKSVVVLHSSACVDAVGNGQVGIGQLFRYLDVLPSFWRILADLQLVQPSPQLQDTQRICTRPLQPSYVTRSYLPVICYKKAKPPSRILGRGENANTVVCHHHNNNTLSLRFNHSYMDILVAQQLLEAVSCVNFLRVGTPINTRILFADNRFGFICFNMASTT
ncbi:unnamed protein product [Choristocarpus tenellus]